MTTLVGILTMLLLWVKICKESVGPVLLSLQEQSRFKKVFLVGRMNHKILLKRARLYYNENLDRSYNHVSSLGKEAV